MSSREVESNKRVSRIVRTIHISNYEKRMGLYSQSL